jgi:hypothetical protein
MWKYYLKTHKMENRNEEKKEEMKQDQPVYNKPGSTLHNDYKIKGDEPKDEKQSYQDYNGNGEEVVKKTEE